jgi:hypothetical protein
MPTKRSTGKRLHLPQLGRRERPPGPSTRRRNPQSDDTAFGSSMRNLRSRHKERDHCRTNSRLGAPYTVDRHRSRSNSSSQHCHTVCRLVVHHMRSVEDNYPANNSPTLPPRTLRGQLALCNRWECWKRRAYRRRSYSSEPQDPLKYSTPFGSTRLRRIRLSRRWSRSQTRTQSPGRDSV